jgi:RNA polymerase sigma factor (TIGR02999 family)
MPESITVLLSRLKRGERGALDQLIAFVYPELHRIAEGYVRRESRGHTLQATALIHEAYLRLLEYGPAEYKSPAHFFGVIARVMRQILVDHARSRGAAKRSSDPMGLQGSARSHTRERSKAFVALDDALAALATEDAWAARLVELRFFGGMTAEEIARSLKTPLHKVRRDLRFARAWLRQQMESRDRPDARRNTPDI